jgi:hypothetical protein
VTEGFFTSASSITHDPTEGHAAAGALKVVVDDDPDVGYRGDQIPWRMIALSGGGIPANNVGFPGTGFVGYWLKTTTPDLKASLLIQDGTGTEQARLRDVISDGQWHLYEWNLGTASGNEWGNSSGGNARIDQSTVRLHALQLQTGVADREIDATLWIDDVAHNPTGSLVPEPQSLTLLALGAVLLTRRRR